jgi:hypothetical protein
MDEWLSDTRARLAAYVGDDTGTYDLDEGDVDRLLELARVAAHDSGARTNAPLLAYLVGVARGRHPDRALADLVDEIAGPPSE